MHFDLCYISEFLANPLNNLDYVHDCLATFSILSIIVQLAKSLCSNFNPNSEEDYSIISSSMTVSKLTLLRDVFRLPGPLR